MLKKGFAHKCGKFAPKFNKKGFAPKCGKFAPKFNKKGFAPKCGKFAPKFNMNKQGRRPMGRQMGNFGPKAPKFNMHKKGFAPKCNGCKCGKKHAPAFRVKRMPAA